MKHTEKQVKVCIAEEQEIFSRTYQLALKPGYRVDLLSFPLTPAGIKQAISMLKPDILILSMRKIEAEILETLAQLKLTRTAMGTILLLGDFRELDADLLRKFATCGGGGVGMVLKQSLEQTAQFRNIVDAVYRGQVVLDSSLSALMLSMPGECPIFKMLTARELEILALIANGYTNPAIAKQLFIDLKTVEHHINNMYGKMKSLKDFDSRHPRVQAARLYLEATGASSSKR
jgi:DNA-binding NarL/FixJ family response regulator